MTLDEELFDALALGMREGVIEAVCPHCREDVTTHRPSNTCNGTWIDLEQVIFRIPAPN